MDVSKVAVVGTGYVGLVTGVCMANLNKKVHVTCLDIDERKIELLNSGVVPIYEPGLKELMKVENLSFSTDIVEIVKNSDVVIIAVGTPMSLSGHADMSQFQNFVNEVLPDVTDQIFIVKSTVPPGTTERLRGDIMAAAPKARVLFCPEFLKEGEAVNDFNNPDRIVMGVNPNDEFNVEATLLAVKLFGATIENLFITDITSAEMIKYASNSMLATRISFINEIAMLCSKVGANVKDVSKGMGLDTRIGPKFLNAGIGYGGSCFPKDVMALASLGKMHNSKMNVLESVIETNDQMKIVPARIVREEISRRFKNSEEAFMKVAILGAAFKPNTDDVRYCATASITRFLLFSTYVQEVRVTDPEAIYNYLVAYDFEEYGERLRLDHDADIYETAKDCDVLILATEWQKYKDIDFKKLSAIMKQNAIFIDGRNVYERDEVQKHGIRYFGIGC